jgi:hypothetical protein
MASLGWKGLTPYRLHTLFSTTRDDNVTYLYQMLIINNDDYKNGNNGTGN